MGHQKGTKMKPEQKPTDPPVGETSAPGVVPEPVKQPSERRIDEEAKARMDDEGGAQEPPADPPAAVPPSLVPPVKIQAVPGVPASKPPVTVPQADGC